MLEVYNFAKSLMAVTATRTSLISYKSDKADLGLVSKSDS